MKYVAFIDTKTDIESIIVFPDSMMHKYMSPGAIGAAREMGNWIEPISAGIVKKEDGQYICYGESESLMLKSRTDDSTLINKFMGN